MLDFIGIIIVLWLLGIVSIPWLHLPKIVLFSVLGLPITLPILIIAIVVIKLALSLGSPFRQILWTFMMLWLLSLFNIVLVPTKLMMIILSIVIGFILSIFQKN